MCIIQAKLLLTADFKILANVLAHRLERVMPAAYYSGQPWTQLRSVELIPLKWTFFLSLYIFSIKGLKERFVFILKSFFETLDYWITPHIWKGKRPWVAKLHLQKPKIAGTPQLLFLLSGCQCLFPDLKSGEDVGANTWLAMELDLTLYFSPLLSGFFSLFIYW